MATKAKNHKSNIPKMAIVGCFICHCVYFDVYGVQCSVDAGVYQDGSV